MDFCAIPASATLRPGEKKYPAFSWERIQIQTPARIDTACGEPIFHKPVPWRFDPLAH